jgi:hypothetical protein
VAVPRTFIIHKDAGQHALIDLRKDDDAVVVSGLRRDADAHLPSERRMSNAGHWSR